jgi:hypothetical protein
MPKYIIKDQSGNKILSYSGDAPPDQSQVKKAIDSYYLIQAQKNYAKDFKASQSQASQLSETLEGMPPLTSEQFGLTPNPLPTGPDTYAGMLTPERAQAFEQVQAGKAKELDALVKQQEQMAGVGVGTLGKVEGLPEFSFEQLPQFQSDGVSQFKMTGMVSPEEDRARLMQEWEALPVGQDIVNPLVGRIRKTGGTKFQVINPNEKAGFLDNVGAGGQFVRNAITRGAIGLGGTLAGDQEVAAQMKEGLSADYEKYKEPLKESGKVAGAMASRTLPLLIPALRGAQIGIPALMGLNASGEIGAELIEGRELSPIEIALAGATAPIGFKNLAPGTGFVKGLAQRTGEGAFISGTNIVGQKIDAAIEGKPVEFNKGDLTNLAVGTAIGGIAGAGEGIANKGLQVLNKAKEPPPMANVATQNAANMAGDNNATQASLNQITTRPPAPPAQQSAEVFERALQQQDEAAEVQRALEVKEVNKKLQAQEASAQFRQTETQAQLLKEQLAQEQAIAQSIAERQAINEQRQLADIQAEAQAFPELQEGFPELSPQAQRMYDDYGRVTPGLLPILSSGAAGGVGGSIYGATQGETPEERAANALRYGGLGMVAAPALTAGVQALSRRLNQPRVARQFTGAMEPQMLDDIVPVAPGSLGQAPAVFRGVQEGLPSRGVPDIELYNITQDIPGHPAGSTISRRTLEANGYTVPQRDLAPTPTSLSSPIEEVSQATPEFLYRETYPTRTGETKTANYFQVDKTPENPRGVTVDDAALVERGYTAEQIQKMADDIIAGRGSPFIGGAQTGAILNPLQAISALNNRLRSPQSIASQVNPPVKLPETKPGTFVREGIENAIRNRDNPLELRQSLADNPDVIGARHSITDVVERMEQLDEAGLRAVLASTSVSDFDKLGAQATLFNRLNAQGRFKEAAPFMAEATKAMTPSAQIINYGKLFKNPEAYAEGINRELEEFGRTLSGKQYDEFTRLGQVDITAEDRFLKAKQEFGKAITVDTAKELNEARKALGPIKRELAQKTAAIIPKRAASLMAQRVKLGLLSIPTVTVGVAGNAVNLLTKELTQPVVAGIDALRSAMTGAPREIANAQTFDAWISGAKTFGRNFKELFTGAADESFALGRGTVGSTPLKDIAQAFGPAENFPVKIKDGVSYVPNRDRAMRLLRGVTGLAALDAPIGRLISLSDNPFREVRRMNLLEEQANLRGLTGDARAQFIENAPPSVQKQVEAEAADTVFAEDNFLTKQIDGAFKAIPKELRAKAKYAKNAGEKMQLEMAADAAELITVAQVPFTKFPVNYVGKAFTLGVPGFALGQALKSFLTGDIRKGEEFLRDAMLNAAGVGAALWLWDKGAVSAPPSTDPKQRTIDYAGLGAGKINISQIKRALSGEWKKGDPTFRSGDITRDLARIGPMAAPVLLTAKYLNKRDFTPPQKVGEEDSQTEALMSYLGGVPSFMLEQSPLTGARSFLQALADSDDENKLKSWLNNTTRAYVSGVLPATLDKLANYNSYPQLLDMRPEKADPIQMAKDIAAYKLQLIPKDSAVSRVTLWGKDIDVNKGINPFYKQFIDPFRTEKVDVEPFEVEVRKAYVDSKGNPDAYPSIPNNRLTIDGQTYKLDKKDAYLLAKERGTMYANRVKAITQNPKWAQLPPQAKVYVLKEIYNRVNTEHGMVIKASPQFRAKYDKPVSKSTKKLLQEEIRNQGVAR